MGTQRTLDEIVGELRSRPHVRHAVLTGGEPMLFPALAPLTHRLRDLSIHITIETAGTIHRDLACDLMSISPKLADSTPAAGDPRDPKGVWRQRHESRRTNVAVLASLLREYRDHQLKFVVSDASHLAEIEALLERLAPVAPDAVLLMPEGVTTPSPRDVAWIVDACLQRGWRFCTRLHIHLFGNTRGT
jgi:7-carboxy-7-deazaguanine synthase